MSVLPSARVVNGMGKVPRLAAEASRPTLAGEIEWRPMKRLNDAE